MVINLIDLEKLTNEMTELRKYLDSRKLSQGEARLLLSSMIELFDLTFTKKLIDQGVENGKKKVT